MSYIDKYIKYKNKYMALQATYLNVINADQKSKSFINPMKGGASISIENNFYKIPIIESAELNKINLA